MLLLKGGGKKHDMISPCGAETQLWVYNIRIWSIETISYSLFSWLIVWSWYFFFNLNSSMQKFPYHFPSSSIYLFFHRYLNLNILQEFQIILKHDRQSVKRERGKKDKQPYDVFNFLTVTSPRKSLLSLSWQCGVAGYIQPSPFSLSPLPTHHLRRRPHLTKCRRKLTNELPPVKRLMGKGIRTECLGRWMLVGLLTGFP